MAKLLKTAALVVGAVALIASGVGAAGGAGLLGGAIASGGTIAGIATAATFTSIGAIAGVIGGVLSLASAAVAPKGTVGGNQTKFTIDKDSGNPVAIGRTLSGGKVVHRQTHGAKNAFESWVTAHSIGPVKSVGPLLIEKVEQAFGGGGAAIGTFAGYMWLATQLGACPEASALPAFNGPVPGWDATSKLSGLAADMWCLKFDSKGKMYPNGVPARGRVIEGVGVYDPRLDSTFPGGSGPCRINDPTTFVLGSENPALHAITWAYGHWQNGTLIAGGGLDITGIDGQPFAEWASVCEANNWKVGGIVYTATDDSWDVLKMIAQAGGGEVMPVGALLSCTFSAPRVSIGTITSADIAGDIDVPGTASRRQRRNTVIPRVRLESQGWEIVPLDALSIPEYVTVDGGKRPKELDLPLVQQADQGAELGLYDVLNGRELDGITLPCKIYALGYRPGDCLTLDIPEAALENRDVIVRNRELDVGSMVVTLTCRTEDRTKHPFALGTTGVPPRTPDLSTPTMVPDAPIASDWTLTGTAVTANGASIPALHLTGAVSDPTISQVIFEYRTDASDIWTAAGTEPAQTVEKIITGVTPGTAYDVAISYGARGLVSDRLILGPVSAGDLNAVIKDGALNSISLPVSGTASVPVPGAGGSTFKTLWSQNVVLSGPGSVTAIATLSQSFPDGDKSWRARLMINGQEVCSAGGAKTADTVALSGELDLPAGTYPVELQSATDSSVSAANRFVTILRFYGA